jgi:Tol biopolymer transport system component
MLERRIGHYDITAHLGSGGMGDVYQATDTKLGRNVALKFLPDAFAHDAGRIARFEREAKALAALNHPHIAAIHGLEESNGRTFLVMELVPGQTLDDLIGRSPLPLQEALAIARQIAEALEAAHEKGIVHRDLKPANVKITPDGRAKVLDFGLAKLMTVDGEGSVSVVNSPTLTAPATHAGVVLGTAAYMAPEQARGRPVDQRADIFAFGCLLYEMVTGRAAFEGDNVPDILVRVLERDPDWSRIPSNAPTSMHRLMRLCLEKDQRKRRQAAGDVRIDLENVLAEPMAVAPSTPHRGLLQGRLAWIAGAAIGIAALAIPAIGYLRDAPLPEMRLQIVTPPTRAPLHFALSPDGRSIVFVAAESPTDTAQHLFLRTLDNTTARPIAGTAGARSPFWSPDGKSIGFFASEKLYRIDISGGPAQALAPAPIGMGGAWNIDGTILFAENTVSALLRVPAGGGDAVAITEVDAPRQLGHQSPSFLPDGRHFLFYATGEPEVSGIYLGSIDGGPAKRLTPADDRGAFLPPNHLLFRRQGALVAREFDAARGELSGDPITLASEVGAFSVSAGGGIAHRSAGDGPQARMTWFDRSGQTVLGPGSVNTPEVSSDGRRVAFDRTTQGNRDVWIMDLARESVTPFTFDPAVDGFPLWSPDGTQIAFESTRNGTFDLWIKPSSGAGPERLLLETSDSEWPLHWSKDGLFLLYQRSDLRTKWDLWALPMTGSDRTPLAVVNSRFAERMGQFSPDGRWVAYETNESGRPEIMVQAFPKASGRFSVSTSGGTAPRWRADGTEIFFIAPDRTMMVVPITTTGPSVEAGRPMALFPTDIVPQPFKSQYTVSRDGRFIVNNLQPEEGAASPITLILNWKP